MSNAISVRASDPASASRALPWPVLEAGNISYPNGVYSIIVDYRQIKDRGRALSIKHVVEGAPLIARWTQAGQLRFACAVAAAVSAYRTLMFDGAAEQTLHWDPDDMGSHPVFTPMVVAANEIEHTVVAEKDGLDPLWDGHELRLPKGAKVAIGPTFALKSGLLGLLDFSLEDDLKPGQFRVDPSHEGGFRFKVRLASDLHGYLRAARHKETRANIMTHIVSAALGVLALKYGQEDDGDERASYPNLEALAALLEANKLPHWSDNTFDPALAATTLHPHQLSIEDPTQDR